ncbi:MAG TPA: UDP-3-O-(3-hydroxymyristoyl)glucosamine N-acyltransferase, partial [Niastella sp.]|nr:UDP-3-O-(3-hydroxymyristoyl)glucosamine N-acyltransferase [Niastella sp.]
YAETEIGNNSILHSGCVIGSDGFGFAPQADGSYKKVPQTGKVIIGNNVEIGANTTIDRATIKATVISDGVKLDNLIQVAHNVEIGENTAIASQTGISGSTKLGKSCVIGGQVGIVGHITIADGTQIGAQSGIAKTISAPRTKWFGSPAIDYKDALKSQILFKKLPDLYQRIQKLEQGLEKR